MVNFYIVNALGQNLANSESCPILRLLKEAKICNVLLQIHDFGVKCIKIKMKLDISYFKKPGLFSGLQGGLMLA